MKLKVEMMFRGVFLQGSENYSQPESRSRVSNLMITELFYSHILNINRGSLHTKSFEFRRIYFSAFRHR